MKLEDFSPELQKINKFVCGEKKYSFTRSAFGGAGKKIPVFEKTLK